MNTRVGNGFLWFCFWAAFFHSVWAVTVGWSHSILDEHSFRQGQTALSAFFLAHGGPFFSYETPVLGPPWSIPFELPVYQWLAAKFHLLTGLGLEQSGRLISRLFFWALLWPLNDALGSLGLSRQGRIAALTLYLLSPLYLFWSRTFLIESTALFFAALYFAAALRAFRGGRLAWLLVGALAGVFAGTVKSTTAFTFFLLAGLGFLGLVLRDLRQRRCPFGQRSLQLLGLFLVPGAATLAWVIFSDRVKEANALADFILSRNLTQWNFGTVEQRLSAKTWYMFFRKTIHDAIGHRTTWLISLALLPWVPRRHIGLALAALAAFLVAPMTFTNLHIAHNYYWYANGIFLVVYLACVVDGLFVTDRAFLRRAGVALFILAVFFSLRHFHKFPLYWQRINAQGYTDLKPTVDSLLREEQVVVIVGADWYPAIAWDLRRRAIMMRKDITVESPAWRRSLDLLSDEGRSVGAVINCAPEEAYTKNQMEGLRRLFPLPAAPRFHGTCDVF